MLWKNTETNRTRFDIGFGAAAKLADVLSQAKAGKKVLVISQRTISENWLPEIETLLPADKYDVLEVNVPEGEECKEIDWLLKIWRRLQEHHFSRNDTIVAIGGGAVTDLAGFAAATYLRGINLVLIPTTLLAQVDAAIGGKTGINLPAGKNLAGTFYFPHATLIDPQFLSTLPKHEIQSGLAEVVKYALLENTIAEETEYKKGPSSLLEILEKNSNNLSAAEPEKNELLSGIITTCIRMKLAVVSQDPTESGLRRCLNLGHTLGHALEKVSNYRISHGQAVSIGTCFALTIATSKNKLKKSESKRAIDLLEAVGLPTEFPDDLDKQKVLEAMAHDKKIKDEQIRFVLPKGDLGMVDYGYNLPLASLSEVLNKLVK